MTFTYAVQGPKDSTVGDFWQMVYERNCAIVIMLTRLVESGTLKKVSAWIVLESRVQGLKYQLILLVHPHCFQQCLTLLLQLL